MTQKEAFIHEVYGTRRRKKELGIMYSIEIQGSQYNPGVSYITQTFLKKMHFPLNNKARQIMMQTENLQCSHVLGVPISFPLSHKKFPESCLSVNSASKIECCFFFKA